MAATATLAENRRRNLRIANPTTPSLCASGGERTSRLATTETPLRPQGILGRVTVAAPSPVADTPSSPDLRSILVTMKEAQRKQGPPSLEQRIRALEALERVVIQHKGTIATTISRDFGNRSSHESLAGEVFVLLGAIRHARAHLRDWMEPERREVGWVFLPSSAQVIPQPVGVVGIISPWNYPVLLALSPLVSALA